MKRFSWFIFICLLLNFESFMIWWNSDKIYHENDNKQDKRGKYFVFNLPSKLILSIKRKHLSCCLIQVEFHRAADTQPTTYLSLIIADILRIYLWTQHSEAVWPECEQCLQRSWIIFVTCWALRRGRPLPARARTRRPGWPSRGPGLV